MHSIKKNNHNFKYGTKNNKEIFKIIHVLINKRKCNIKLCLWLAETTHNLSNVFTQVFYLMEQILFFPRLLQSNPEISCSCQRANRFTAAQCKGIWEDVFVLIWNRGNGSGSEPAVTRRTRAGDDHVHLAHHLIQLHHSEAIHTTRRIEKNRSNSTGISDLYTDSEGKCGEIFLINKHFSLFTDFLCKDFLWPCVWLIWGANIICRCLQKLFGTNEVEIKIKYTF